MMKMNKIIRKIYLLLFLLPILFSCTANQDKKPLDQVTVQLKWIHTAQFAGFYMAKERGYYADENLSVNFLEGGPGVDTIDRVVSGQAEFGVFGPELLLQARQEGKPVVATAVVYRRNPFAFIALKSSGIKHPVDFIGRTAAIGYAHGNIQLQAMMSKLGLDPDGVNVAPYEYDYTSFRSGEVDLTLAYTTNSLIRLRAMGEDISVFRPGDYGVHLYADTLFTTDELISRDPELVTRFIRATLRGWRDTIEYPKAAILATLTYGENLEQSLQEQMLRAVVPLVHTGEESIGWMEEEIWRGMHDVLIKQDILPEPVDLDQVYTIKFLEKIYGTER